MVTKKKPRNRAAQDATLLNIRALKKRMTVVERGLLDLAKIVNKILGTHVAVRRR